MTTKTNHRQALSAAASIARTAERLGEAARLSGNLAEHMHFTSAVAASALIETLLTEIGDAHHVLKRELTALNDRFGSPK